MNNLGCFSNLKSIPKKATFGLPLTKKQNGFPQIETRLSTACTYQTGKIKLVCGVKCQKQTPPTRSLALRPLFPCFRLETAQEVSAEGGEALANPGFIAANGTVVQCGAQQKPKQQVSNSQSHMLQRCPGQCSFHRCLFPKASRKALPPSEWFSCTANLHREHAQTTCPKTLRKKIRTVNLRRTCAENVRNLARTCTEKLRREVALRTRTKNSHREVAQRTVHLDYIYSYFAGGRVDVDQDCALLRVEVIRCAKTVDFCYFSTCPHDPLRGSAWSLSKTDELVAKTADARPSRERACVESLHRQPAQRACVDKCVEKCTVENLREELTKAMCREAPAEVSTSV